MRTRKLSGAAVATVVTVAAVMIAAGLAWTGSGSAVSRGEWVETPVDFPTDYGGFGDVLPLGAREVWAAGHDNSAESSLMARWDGRKWSRVDVPNIGRVAALTGWKQNVWAAGDDGVLHWDGRTWTRTPVETDEDGRLSDIAIEPRTGRGWAVGDEQIGTFEHRGRMWRYDGEAWSEVDLGIEAHDWTLAGVAVRTPKDAWATGYRQRTVDTPAEVFVLRWNGRAWREVQPPPITGTAPQLGRPLVLGPDEVWFHGATADDNGEHPLLARWNRGRWTVTERPDDCASLVDLARTPAGLVAVGFTCDTWTAYTLEHRNGTWERGTVPPSEPTLFGIGVSPQGRTWVAAFQQTASGDPRPAAAYRD